MHVILVGNLTVGFHAVGPFTDWEAAHEHARRGLPDGLRFVFKVYAPVSVPNAHA